MLSKTRERGDGGPLRWLRCFVLEIRYLAWPLSAPASVRWAHVARSHLAVLLADPGRRGLRAVRLRQEAGPVALPGCRTADDDLPLLHTRSRLAGRGWRGHRPGTVVGGSSRLLAAIAATPRRAAGKLPATTSSCR